MLTTFLRESNGQPYEGGGDGLDCECVSSTDERGVVTTICLTRRNGKRHPVSKPNKAEAE